MQHSHGHIWRQFSLAFIPPSLIQTGRIHILTIKRMDSFTVKIWLMSDFDRWLIRIRKNNFLWIFYQLTVAILWVFHLGLLLIYVFCANNDSYATVSAHIRFFICNLLIILIHFHFSYDAFHLNCILAMRSWMTVRRRFRCGCRKWYLLKYLPNFFSFHYTFFYTMRIGDGI